MSVCAASRQRGQRGAAFGTASRYQLDEVRLFLRPLRLAVGGLLLLPFTVLDDEIDKVGENFASRDKLEVGLRGATGRRT